MWELMAVMGSPRERNRKEVRKFETRMKVETRMNEVTTNRLRIVLTSRWIVTRGIRAIHVLSGIWRMTSCREI